MMVPNRRPPSPHSCNRSRSPRRHRAAAKPSQVMKANSATKMMRAVQFTCGTESSVPSRPRAPPARCLGWSLVLGRKVNYCGQDGAEDDPEQLVPIEEWHTDQRRFDPVVERRPENRDELNKKEQVPPAPSAALARLLVHPHRCFSLDLRSDNASCHAAFHRATVRVRRPPKICADGNPTDLHQ
jgi:hypothetical protein